MLAAASAASGDVGAKVDHALREARANRLESAEQELREALASEPDSVSALYALGLVRLQRGDARGAREVLTRCVALDRAHGEPRLALGKAEFRLGKRDSAQRSVDEAARLGAGSAAVLIGAGIVYSEMGLHAKAAAAFESAIPLAGADPAPRAGLIRALVQGSGRRRAAELAQGWRSQPDLTAAAHNEIGIAFAEARVYREAIEEFRAAMRTEPSHPEAGANLAMAYYYAQEFPEASATLRTLLERQDSAALRYLLGLTLESMRRPDEAVEAFSAAARLDPGRADAWLHLGRIALDKHLAGEAQRCFGEARARCTDGACVEALIGLGTAYKLLGQGRQAEEAYQEAVRRAPRDFTGYLYLGDALIRARRYEEAVEPLGKAVQLEPRSSLYHYMYAYALMHGGDQGGPEAVTHLREAIRLDPANGLAWYRLGLIRSKAGQYGEAAPLLAKAVDLEPKLKEAHYQLGVALQKLGKAEESRTQFAEYRKLSQSSIEEGSRLFMEFERTSGRGR
jgi:tetratricopeptide (TPR) repeat protein